MRNRWIGAAVGLAVGLLALGPAMKPGYLLFYDMVFVPRLGLSQRTLGVDGSVPRAVPNDLVVALASHLLPGWAVQHLLLLLIFVGAGAGTAALCRTPWGAAAAALAATWNPYVAQRLAIGHWGFLLGYAALPFVAYAARELRAAPSRSARIRLGTWIVLIALTGSTGAILGAVLLAAVLLVPLGDGRGPAWRELRWVVPGVLLANAAWWWPFLTLAPTGGADPAGALAFMARPDTPLGVWGSVITGGGIWNRSSWFVARQSLFVALLALVAVLVCVAVLVRSRRFRADAAYRGAVVAGGLGLLVAVAGALPGGETVVSWTITHVPGGGLIRDGQKFVAIWMLAVALGAGILIERLVAAGRRVSLGRLTIAGLAVVIALWPMATLPGLAWGGGGRWAAVPYPDSFLRMADRLNAAAPGAVAVFPWTLYRQYAWNADRTVLDPWQRLVDRVVYVNDDLPLSDRVVRGESATARAISVALVAGDPVPVLRREGVRWVLLQTDQPAIDHPIRPALTPVVRDGDLTLYDLGPASGVSAPGGILRYAGLLALAISVLGAFVGAIVRVRSVMSRATM